MTLARSARVWAATAALAGPALAQTPAPPYQALLEAINRERAGAGAAALELHPALAAIAQHHSEELAAAQYLGHESPVYGIGYLQRLAMACGMAAASAENVARVPRPLEAVPAFLDSPGHRANLLSPRYTHVGVGLARAESDEWFIVVDFAAGWMPPGPRCPRQLYWQAGLPETGLPHTAAGIRDYRFLAPAEERAVQRALEALRQGRNETAEAAAREALRSNPHYPYARAALATALLRQSRLVEAREQARRYRDEFPGDPEGSFLMARIAEASGHCQEAIQEAQAALEALPQHREAWYVLGLARERCGDREGARAAYQELAKLDPLHQGAFLGLRRTAPDAPR
ncbi:MAG TPA: tetratricopeptide repeat protein [Acidobacteriota bacterium]